ncbi:Uu.00g015040.m01.CDS01 [Anthostomella pinea]|uniref:Uu.00g015040.m01.CDS01 n=1 Tax=Anthostomella pinea TaxID=933095 RepID=A0AAI8YQF2_9PEZI|nr:Uu.00g015040.m01.CDS01 [Anthostomella pinea]
MATRPRFIDLRADSSSSVATGASSVSRPLRSPRLHVAGDVPPALSPLDAFAAQSRLLAKQLEESSKAGSRMSRLPPLTVESPLVVQGRSEYFRSLSHDSAAEELPELSREHTGLGWTTELESPSERPVSTHPRMSRIPPTPDDSTPISLNPFREAYRGRPLDRLDRLDENRGVFGARREQSPADLESLSGHAVDGDTTEQFPGLREASPYRGRFPPSPERFAAYSHDATGLVPPNAHSVKRSSSIMSAPSNSYNDEALSASFHSHPGRKLSSSSAFSGLGLASPVAHYQRSPSISSEASAQLPRPSFNFSRPLSRAGTPTLDAPSRQASSDSHPSFVLADDTAHTPISMHSDAFTESGTAEDGKGAPSYIYSKYSLPRGKSLQRNSVIFRDDDPSTAFVWEQPMVPLSNVQTYPQGGHAPPSPPTRPSSSSSRYQDGPPASGFLSARPSLERSKLSTEMSAGGGRPSLDPSRPSTGGSRPSEDVPRGRALTSPPHDQAQARGHTPMSLSTSDSASTIRPPRSQHSHAPTAAEMSAEEHLTKGIKCHEDGSVKESTYHLRLAARGGDPTGMLLYALACRHGWGMRPNQREGVEWLRKAADAVSAEIADDEDQVKGGKTVDFMDRKTRKAQFALSIYELGVSHMNGWGIEQDKALAVRCFEIAGSWGDVDALTEAGFCYAQGVGCKKDLRKSARFYRQAEAKGMSMPGNSWIHKPKYSDDAGSIKSKKARSKSRGRGMFGKKPKETSA